MAETGWARPYAARPARILTCAARARIGYDVVNNVVRVGRIARNAPNPG
jgi:hypothetical protein